MCSRFQMTFKAVWPSPSRRIDNADMFVDVGANTTYFHCDITSRDQVRKTAEEIRATLGSPSILINNAGIGAASTILEAKAEDLRKILYVLLGQVPLAC